jgi:hypothetical protein
MPYADNHGVHVHYEVEGEGPPLVLQHGFTDSLRTWYELVHPQFAVLFSFLFGPLRRQSTPNTDEIKKCGECTYENHEHRKHHHLDPPPGLAGDRPDGMGHAGCQEARTPVRVTREPDGRRR